ncbi:hypothetical protein GCM10023219_30060 [Stakelama sediminis]|uniref:Phasin family protein n=1 Tax=Stakelama sediminis TaxID=463200 RepID=A0A840Z2W4_9SPHN|nr:phasin family protein [Stakelama sediminis]MBB5720087.1 phasin family protein [Stakelama sediminis]
MAQKSANDTMQDAARNAADRMKDAWSTMMESGSQLGVKMLDQAETNTQEAFKAMRAAAQASDISEVMRVQSEYLREQGSRSVAQAREISEMIANFGRNALGQMTGKK